MEEKQVNRAHLGLAVLLAGTAACLVLAFIAKDYPKTGHDYGYFLPRLLDTYLHGHQNGPGVQWYTPSFGGGLPAHPNPQHLQFSIPQLLTAIMDPWQAILASTFLLVIGGFLSTWYLLTRVARLHTTAALLGAFFFSTSGFYLEHMAVGHVGYQLFPLLPLIAAVLLAPDAHLGLPATILALILAMFVHQAGFYLALIAALSILMTLPILYLHDPTAVRVRPVAWRGGLGLGIMALLCASKICAVSSFMNHFPRHVVDESTVPLTHAVPGIAAQLLGVTGLAPFELLRGGSLGTAWAQMKSATGETYGIWELDSAVSPVLIGLLAWQLVAAASRRPVRRPRLETRRYVAAALLLLSAWLAVEFTTGKGLIYPSLRQLPFLRSMHVNVRFTATFILPLAILGALAFHSLTRTWTEARKAGSALLLGAVGAAFLLSYFLSSDQDLQQRCFDPRQVRQAYVQARHGDAFPVETIGLRVPDGQVFLQHASSLPPYEPIFGYNLAQFRPTVVPGPVDRVTDGCFNMTDPRSLVYPLPTHTGTFQRIPVSDRDNFLRFVNRQSPHWPLPLGQRLANGLSGIGLALAAGLLLVEAVRAWRRRQRRAALDARS